MIRTLNAALGAFFLMVAVALSVFLAGATDADLYFRVQQSLDGGSGLFDGAIREADEVIANYLANGGEGLVGARLFSDRAVSHMRDVYELLRDMQLLRRAAFPLGAALVFAAAFKNHRWRRALLVGGAIGAALFLLPLAAAGVWALIDFHGAFRAMHGLLFDNMLWLLDPSDFLIRLLPEAFFEKIGAILAVRSVLFALIPPGLMALVPLLDRKWMRR